MDTEKSGFQHRCRKHIGEDECHQSQTIEEQFAALPNLDITKPKFEHKPPFTKDQKYIT